MRIKTLALIIGAGILVGALSVVSHATWPTGCYKLVAGCSVDPPVPCPSGYIGGNGGPCGTTWREPAAGQGQFYIADSCVLAGATGWTEVHDTGVKECDIWVCWNVQGYCTNPSILNRYTHSSQLFTDVGQFCIGDCYIAGRDGVSFPQVDSSSELAMLNQTP